MWVGRRMDMEGRWRRSRVSVVAAGRTGQIRKGVCGDQKNSVSCARRP